MHITRLRLTDFQRHEDLEIRPHPGLTIIRGPNEAGKTTIQKAIELALFRKADANREDIRRAWAWGSSDPPTVELDIEVDGVASTLRKRFGGARSEGELTTDGTSVTDYALIGEEIAELMGVPSESFYRATASVGHAELDAVGGDEPAIGDRLQKAISGADRGTAKAKKKLETAIHRYRTEGHKNPGLLKVAREQIELLERELSDGEAALARLQADRAQWVEADERRAELEIKLNRQQADLAEAQRAEELAQKRDGAQDRYQRLKRGAELTESYEEARRELPTSLPIGQLRATVSVCQSLELELSEVQAEIDTAIESADAATPDLVPPRPMRWLAAAALLVVAGWMAMFLLADSGFVGVGIVAAIAVGVVITLVQAFRLARKRRQYGLAMQLAEDEIAVLREQAREREELHRRRRRELDGKLEALGVDNVRAAEGLLATAESQTERMAQIEGELRGLGIEDSSVRRLEEARDQAANEAEQAAHALAAMGSLAEDPARARAEAQRQVARTAPARDAARSEADQAQGRVDANQVDAELVAGLAERLAAARSHYADLEGRLRIYQGTLAAIDAAEAATLKTAARYLEEHMGPAISAVTDGRYDDIEVDEKSLAFRVRVPETGELVDVEQLSQGTADQLFLTARLGLVRLVTLDRRPPLILDDPFVTFDAARGERALRLVKDVAHRHGFQVLYLTCSDRFDRLADEVVVLPGPSNERVPAHPKGTTPPGPAPSPAPVPAMAAAEPSSGASEPTLRFEPDPRPNPDPVAPRRTQPHETVMEPLFADPADTGSPAGEAAETDAAPDTLDAAEAAERLAALRAERAARSNDDGADPVESLREATGEAPDVGDPFTLSGPDRDEATD